MDRVLLVYNNGTEPTAIRYESGTMSSPVTVGGAASDSESHQIAFAPNGDAFVCWDQAPLTGSGWNIWANQFLVTGGWQTATRLDSLTQNSAWQKICGRTRWQRFGAWNRCTTFRRSD